MFPFSADVSWIGALKWSFGLIVPVSLGGGHILQFFLTNDKNILQSGTEAKIWFPVEK